MSVILKANRLRCILLILSGIPLLSPAVNLPDSPQSKEFIIQHWNSQHGLPVNSIHAMAQTKDGFIWMATQEGLVRFDGFEFITFSQKNNPAFLFNDIYSLLVCRDGSLLIGCHAGHLILYKDRIFRLLTHPELYGGKNVTALAEDDHNTYWIGTSGGGLGHFRNQADFSFLRNTDGLPDNIINALLPDGQGGLWIGTQAGLSHYFQGRFSNYCQKDGLTDNYIRCLYLDQQQTLWIGTQNGGLNRFYQGKFSPYHYGKLKKNQTIVSITGDTSGNLWIAANGEGIYRISASMLSPFSLDEGLPSNNIHCLLTDLHNHLWMGTLDAGISLLQPRLVNVFTSKDGLSDNVIMPVFSDKQGGIWIGTAKGGLNYYNHENFSQFQKKMKLPGIPLTSITEDASGTLWIGTAGSGLYAWKDGLLKNYTLKDGLLSNVINAVYADRKGRLWIGTDGGGLSRYEKGRFTTLTSREGLSHDQINCLLQDKKGRMWVGTNGGGINRLDEEKIKWITSENGLRDDEILSLYEDHDGILWVGCSHAGLVMIRNDSVEVFSKEDGLDADKIQQILEDAKGNLWMSGPLGIFSVSKKALLELADGKSNKILSVHYGVNEGMLSSECTSKVFPAGCRGRDQELWFPTLNGLIMIDAARQKQEMPLPSICLTRVFVNEQEVVPDQEITLQPGLINLEIQYTSPGFNPLRELSFKYKLEGFDLYWINAGSRRSAFYTHLPPGRYEFKVTATNDFGGERKMESLIKINILPYFYQTAWFFLICAIAALFIFWFLVRYQYRKIKEKQLNRLVEERTRELREEIRQKELAQSALSEAKDRIEQSDRLKSSLLAFLDQDFRTPVNSIMGFSEILMQDKASEKEPGISHYIHESGKHLLDTLDSAMLLAQLDPGKDPPSHLQDLIPLIQAALNPLQKVSEGGERQVVTDPESEKPKPFKPGPYQLLLVEDNEINAALVKSYIGKDYEVDVAIDGNSALEKVAVKQYDAILMDINLGKGIDGLTATQKIREIPSYQSTPIIAVTGYTMAGMQERLIDGGCSYYLAKPFGKKLLVDLLITILPEKKQTE